MKQTAVDWLVMKWTTQGTLHSSDITKAIEMEKEQIMTTAWHCHIEGVKQPSKTSREYIEYAEQYYNETYGQK
jgi:hypothetical protein